MDSARFVSGSVAEGFVEVDAARLLLILAQFSAEVHGTHDLGLPIPSRPFLRHFTPEYYLHKLDFLLRYPNYFAYELVELRRLEIAGESDTASIREIVSGILQDREPELRTQPFRRFWRGAYERIDQVEAWWYARELVYITLEPRGQAPSQKHYFLSPMGLDTAERLVRDVPEVAWYAGRIALLHRFFGSLTPAQLRDLQYAHQLYREAQLQERIPDLAPEEVEKHLATALGEETIGIRP
jgi:hypothetical protein